MGAAVGFFVTAFLAVVFLGAAFLFTGAFLAVGIGMVMPPWPACCASAGADRGRSAIALTAANSFIVTDFLRLTGGPASLGAPALAQMLLLMAFVRALRGLPVREFYDLPDPRRDVLETALRRGRAYRVALTEP